MKSPYAKNATSATAAAARPALEPFVRIEGESMEEFEARAKARILQLHAQEAADCEAHRAKMAELDRKRAEFDAKKILLDQAMADMEANTSKENIEKVRRAAADLFKKEEQPKQEAPKAAAAAKTEAPKAEAAKKTEVSKAASATKTADSNVSIGKVAAYAAGAVAIGAAGYFAWKRWGSN